MNALSQKISFHDFQPELESFREAVLKGLSRRQKQIAPKFFYDETGSKLFEAILEQPEYYIPNVERDLLQSYADEIGRLIEPGSILIEPGSGSCEKVQLLLESLLPSAYVPMDISREFLKQSACDLGQQFPWLTIYAACLDFTQQMILPQGIPQGRRVVFIPGSSLGNFDPLEVQHFLTGIHRLTGKGGGLLIGLDRKKEPSVLNAAYNDAAGITAEFNRNLLTRINNELDGHFDLDRFEHRAFYNDQRGRIEMHLVSREEQQVSISGQDFRFIKGETIHTENSYKYSPDEFMTLANAGGFKLLKLWSDDNHLFSIYFLVAV
ncbi:MAG: L-histidine N(alpha)-methyltransferase [Methylicorpusculum sp.]|uniref:L-histidine N(alpha)-methyltransferase n=2 Tax=Methylicorpusculum sp. TaxID=2713644 RepID=UPI002715BBE6|nr:L-histidine N(alpha)-methyltransferase [Methylicorpusculum sp.]MDO8843723.1 L-histidine N(alpha)-methyltransferase [Methylicorpusculum sp.]MDO8938137.1 L-histidine N(alpha)-methyltransferase [Methylicorpusculum sp.]MDO9241252.1 L-histidine N(alpha)-methyltransferase [Methylicorpusculum sp.]MDP2204201.1 L-histidine N(alpha)-methyltransferase [Methylicorpusculum sp.]